MAVPVWLGATAGAVGQAGQLNQFLGTHDSAWTYSGATLRASRAVGNTFYLSTTGQYLAQQFTTASAQTTIGQVWLQVSTVGGSPVTATIAPLTLSLYAVSGVFPTGSPLASVTVTEPYVYSAPFWVPFPLVVAGLTPSTIYQLVLSPAGSGSAYYVWQETNTTPVSLASPDGVTWTAQAHGLMYQVFDQTGSGRLLSVYDDAGARWLQLTYDAQGRVGTVTEYCVTQGGGTVTSTRTLTYSGTFLTGVS